MTPAPGDLVGREMTGVGRRGKFVCLDFAGGQRVALHLAQAGRVDLESPPKTTKSREAVARFAFSNGTALLVREYGRERRAGWWVLAPGDDGPLAALGPDAGTPEAAALLATSDDHRQLHTVLRDQRFVAGLGRGHGDDVVHRARLSPFASLRGLDDAGRARLTDAIEDVLATATERERTRTGGLSAPRLGDRFTVHNRAGQPCPDCGATLRKVSYESHELTYCPSCQTGGRVLADRRLSRLLR